MQCYLESLIEMADGSAHFRALIRSNTLGDWRDFQLFTYWFNPPEISQRFQGLDCEPRLPFLLRCLPCLWMLISPREIRRPRAVRALLFNLKVQVHLHFILEFSGEG